MVLNPADSSHKFPDTPHCYLWTYFCPPLFTHTAGLRLLPLQTPWEDSEVLGFFCLSSLLVDDLLTCSCSYFTWQFSTLIRAYIPHVRLPTSWSSRSTMTSVALSGSSSLYVLRQIFVWRLCFESLWHDLCTALHNLEHSFWTSLQPCWANYCKKNNVC